MNHQPNLPLSKLQAYVVINFLASSQLKVYDKASAFVDAAYDTFAQGLLAHTLACYFGRIAVNIALIVLKNVPDQRLHNHAANTSPIHINVAIFVHLS